MINNFENSHILKILPVLKSWLTTEIPFSCTWKPCFIPGPPEGKPVMFTMILSGSSRL